MAKKKSKTVWVKLQISEENAAFAEAGWAKLRYFSRDDYLNALLNGALMREVKIPKPRKEKKREIPGARAEFDEFNKRIEPLFEASEQRARTVPVAVDMPLAWAMMAAWVQCKEEKRELKNFEPLPDFSGDFELISKSAARYAKAAIYKELTGDMHMLEVGEHHLLFPPLWETGRKTKEGGGAGTWMTISPFKVGALQPARKLPECALSHFEISPVPGQLLFAPFSGQAFPASPRIRWRRR